MSLIDIELDGGRTAYEPGDTLSGSVSFDLPGPPSSLDVCLIWTAQGGGAREHGVAVRVPIERAASRDRRAFQLTVPDGPYSYAGRLLTLDWAVEVQAEPAGRTARAEIVIAPGGLALAPAR